jgi:hypothetical protein
MAKKKSINLSDLLKKYDIQDDVNQYRNGGEMYGLGGDIGAGTAGVAKGIAGSLLPSPIGSMATQGIDTIHGTLDKDITDQERSIAGYGQAAGALGTAIATGGATTPQSIAVGAEGLGQGVSAGSPDSELAQQAGGIANLAGQFGGMVTGDPKVPVKMENGGNLTEYNGNTHENGGIAIGQDKEVEDKETRWEDYIFSENVKVPSKDYSFSDASKRINKKYSQRENDKYDQKALKKEMNGLMGMQESERQVMSVAHNEKMTGMFGESGSPEQYVNGGQLFDKSQLDAIKYAKDNNFMDENNYTTNKDYTEAANSGFTKPPPMPDPTNVTLDRMNVPDISLEEAMTQKTPLSSKLDESNKVEGSDYVAAPKPGDGGGMTAGRAGLFAAQNIGNLYNLKQGMSSPEEISLGRMEPKLNDSSAAIRNIQDTYARAKKSSDGAIRANTTSGGQTLSNRIASNTALSGKEADDTSRVIEDTDNRNSGISNAAQRTNLGIIANEEQINTQTEAARQQAMQAGLAGIGSSIAGESRDGKMYDAQGRAIANLGTSGSGGSYRFESDGKGGWTRINNETGLPA